MQCLAILVVAAAASLLGSAEAAVASYDWHAVLRNAAPDCFNKEIVTMNGEFQPEIRLRQGDTLEVGMTLPWSDAARPAVCSNVP